MPKRQRISRAVAFEHQATQAQQGRAVIAAVIHPPLERPQHGVRQHSSQLREPVAGKLLLEEGRHHGRQPLAGFERHIAHKPVAHHNVGGAFENIIALDIAVKIQAAIIASLHQQLARLLDHFIALDGFFADIEQAHCGLLFTAEHRHQSRPHHGKLQQMFCLAIHIGAQIQHRGARTQGIGQLKRNGRAVNPFHGFEQIARHRHQSAGVARRNRRMRRTCAHLANGHAHGRIFFAPQRSFHRVVHADHFRGRHDSGSAFRQALHAGLLRPHRLQRFGLPHQQQRGIRVAQNKLRTRRQRNLRTMVTPHAINGQHHFARVGIARVVCCTHCHWAFGNCRLLKHALHHIYSVCIVLQTEQETA